jgi:hypothetical protein
MLATAQGAPVGLRCDYLQNPLGIDSQRPDLSWRSESSERDSKQTAYRVTVAEAISSATTVTGNLSTSSQFVDAMYKTAIWGQRSNFISVPTDCPQRDERLGYTGDARFFGGLARTTRISRRSAGSLCGTSWVNRLDPAPLPTQRLAYRNRIAARGRPAGPTPA